MSTATVHAGCVVIGPHGVLIRGLSGSGKSALADAMIEAARMRGSFSALVSDDRSCLEDRGAQVVASAPEPLQGLIEVRGLGLQSAPFEPEAVVRMVIDLLPEKEIERLPVQPLADVVLEGISVPALQVASDNTVAALSRVRWALRQLFPNGPDYL
ncbi:HPr kinase/phosphorylase [Roseibium polysiphoniae]|uniref:HPr kinase/phosphatase C-terminal domain-containing protein n=1 Tax=Roseibium polysiphoniae TaxID=2571221 RepID=A0ABR9CHA8_9HYPH|nr:HPr kinase/phosphatase C-terminal domain-containing protein [Roseibium polysiphoniae]MBD8878526.1 HPr kinase/phosphatase C-terminal domain-containing protein [Roseibium polysiphoniae]